MNGFAGLRLPESYLMYSFSVLIFPAVFLYDGREVSIKKEAGIGLIQQIGHLALTPNEHLNCKR